MEERVIFCRFKFNVYGKVKDSTSRTGERIYDITYHISSSPYYSEDIHTDYPRVSLKGVMTQG